MKRNTLITILLCTVILAGSYAIVETKAATTAFQLGRGFLETLHDTWKTCDGRSGIAAADAAFGATARKWADRPTTKIHTLLERENVPAYRFRFNTAGANATFYFWGYSEGDDAEPICTVTVYAGTQTATMGGYYAGKIVVTSCRYGTEWTSSDEVGHDEMARLSGDSIGIDAVFPQCVSISAGTVSIDRKSY